MTLGPHILSDHEADRAMAQTVERQPVEASLLDRRGPHRGDVPDVLAQMSQCEVSSGGLDFSGSPGLGRTRVEGPVEAQDGETSFCRGWSAAS